MKVLSRKTPFYHLDNDHQVKEAVLRGDHPLRPKPEEGNCDAIDDQMWDLLQKCWNKEPEGRPSCEVIREFLTKMDIQDDRPPAAPGAARKFANKVKIDYNRVENILHRVSDRISVRFYAAHNIRPA